MPSQEEITVLLTAVRQGNSSALDKLFPLIYEELHRQAQIQRRRWHGNKTLNTTALVHEAYLKLINQDQVHAEDRSHFFALATKAMRHILINYAEKQKAAKRGGDQQKIPLEEINPVSEEAAGEVLALDEALKRLSTINKRQSRVVECRFFAGLTIQETAAVLEISPATVKRDWSAASAWLYRELCSTAKS